MKTPRTAPKAGKQNAGRHGSKAESSANKFGSASSKLTDIVIDLGLALLTFAVFAQTYKFEFVNFDDGSFVSKSPVVTNGLKWSGIVSAFAHGSHANWDPITTISHMLDWQFFGPHPGGHHLMNVLLHAVTVVLLFEILRRMTGARWQSAFVAAVFAVHPLRAESVAWVSERKDVLSGLFFMLTLAAYTRYAHRPKPTRYLLMLVCFACGLMSKAMLITMPAVLLLLDWWPLNRFRDAANDRNALRNLFLEKVPMLALSAGTAVASSIAQRQYHAFESLQDYPVGSRAANALDSVVQYLREMFIPVHLAVYYPYPFNGLSVWRIALAIVIVGGISFVAWRSRSQRPYLLVGWAWNLIMVLPVIGLIQLGGQARADRYTYLPQIGIAFAVAGLAGTYLQTHPRRSAFFAVAAGCVIAGLSAAAWRQTGYWKNSLALWERCLAVTRENPMADYNYGVALVEQRRFADATPYFREKVRLNPDDPAGHGNLGGALFQTGQYDEAIEELAEASRLDPTNASLHVNRGNALFLKHQTNDAIAEYQNALKLDPADATAEYTLGNALMQTGQVDDAITHLQNGVKLDPSQPLGHFTLATALLKKGRLPEATKQLQLALAINPAYSPALDSLNDIAWRLATSPDAGLRNGGEALNLARGLVQLTGGHKVIFLRTLAAACAESGQYAEAITVAEQALQMANQSRDNVLAGKLQNQLNGYRANLPFRDAALTQQPAP